MILGQSEHYVEYGEDGKVTKGQELAVPKSKYVEDVKESNHSEIWGSYWDSGKWGYRCCFQQVRNSYCTGEAGRAAAREMARANEAQAAAPAPAAAKGHATEEKTKTKEHNSSSAATGAGTGSSSLLAGLKTSATASGEISDDESGAPKKKKSKTGKNSDQDEDSEHESDGSDAETRKARKAAEKRKAKIREALLKQPKGGKEKEKEESMVQGYDRVGAPSNKQMESYMRARVLSDDPMAKFKDTVED